MGILSENSDRNFGLNRLLTDEQYAEMKADDEVPAVGPDYPAPLTGPLARQTIEDQITESDRRDSRDLEIFILGALAGACWAGLVALAIL